MSKTDVLAEVENKLSGMSDTEKDIAEELAGQGYDANAIIEHICYDGWEEYVDQIADDYIGEVYAYE